MSDECERQLRFSRSQAVQRKPQRQPDPQRNPLGSRKVIGKQRKHLHDEKKERDQNAETCNDAQAWTWLHEPEGNARCQPAERRSHGANLRHRNEERIAEKKANDRGSGDAEDGDRGGLKFLVDAAEYCGNSLATAVSKQQAAGSDEVAVETLEKAEESHNQNHTNRPARAKGLLERNRGCETVAEKHLPARDVADCKHGESVEAGAQQE